MSYGERCVVCKNQDSLEAYSNQYGGVNIKIRIKRDGETFPICEKCVREIINAERRRKYADKNWARKQLKILERLENCPSEVLHQITTGKSGGK